MDQDLLELSRKVAQGDYLAAKRATELIAKKAEDPTVKEEAEAERKKALLLLKIKRAREESYDQVEGTLRGLLAAVREARENPILHEEWMRSGAPLDEFWKRVQGLLEPCRGMRRHLCGRCEGTGVVKSYGNDRECDCRWSGLSGSICT